MQTPPQATLRLARVADIHIGTLDWLTAEERHRFEGMASQERRNSFLAGHYLARQMAAAWHDVDFGRLSVHRLADGRPCLHVDHAPSPLSLSLSHSGGWILAGVASAPLGVDVEVPRRQRDIDALARHAFARAEAEYLASTPNGDRLGTFHELWALKEARGKRTGEGMLPGQSRRVQALPATPLAAQAVSWRLGEGGAVALALEGVEGVRLDADGALARSRRWRFESVGPD